MAVRKEPTQAEREKTWRKGKHIRSNGEVVGIENMPTPYLRNAIYYFAGMDIEPLKKELEKRLSTDKN